MIILAWTVASMVWMLGLLLLFHTLTRWQHKEKQLVKYSELLQVGLFFIMGVHLLMLVPASTAIPVQIRFYGIIFWAYLVTAFFFLGTQVFPHYIRQKLNPEYRKGITYDKFLGELHAKYDAPQTFQHANRIKDYFRKFLHIFQYLAIVLIHIWTSTPKNTEMIESWGIPPIAFRNLIYLLVAGFMWIMMMVGDLVRMGHWEFLPKWGWTLYTHSLQPHREEWTLNSTIAISLANLFWLFPGGTIPLQVFFTAIWASCVADAFASLIGNQWGTHRWRSFGNFPQKTVEGTLGGGGIMLIGALGTFLFFPIANVSFGLIIGITVGSAMLFMGIDVFEHRIDDNIVNSLVIGAFTWGCLVLFL